MNNDINSRKVVDKYGFQLDEITKEFGIYDTFFISLVYSNLKTNELVVIIAPFKRHNLFRNIRKFKEIQQGVKNKNIIETLAYLINETEETNMDILKLMIDRIPSRLLVNEEIINNEFIATIKEKHPEYIKEFIERIKYNRKYILEHTNYRQKQEYLKS